MTDGGKIGCAVSFLVFAIVLMIMGILDTSGVELTGERWVAGSSYSREFSLDKSVNGHFRIVKVEGSFQPDGGKAIPVLVVSQNSKSWDSTISYNVVKVKGVPVVSGRKKINAQFGVNVPSSSELIGKRGEIVINGVVEYPFLALADVVVETSSEPKIEVKETEFEKRIPDILIVNDLAQEKNGGGWLETLLGFLVFASIIGALISLGNREEYQ